MENLRRLRAWINRDRHITVRSWCLICGEPVLLSVEGEYEKAKRFFYGLDDQPMAHHPGQHAETGGWGIHWRLDEVLCAVFPDVHGPEIDRHGELWPIPPYYEHSMSEDKQVEIIDELEAREISMRHMAEPRNVLQQGLNMDPQSRDELEATVGEVWDEDELSQEFEILGFRPPFAMVKRRFNGARGTVLYQDDPRYYFNFEQDRII